MISLFLFLIFFFQTFNGNFDQNTVEKQILFSAFVARYLRFVVGSTHGGACLRVEVSGIPRSSGLIFLIAEIVQFVRNIVFYPVVEPSLLRIIKKIFFPFCNNIISWTIIIYVWRSLSSLLATKDISQERGLQFCPKDFILIIICRFVWNLVNEQGLVKVVILFF